MKIIAIGNALVDLVVMLPSDEVLKELNLVKGSMNLIEKQQRKVILERVKDYPQKIVSGGSAANTAVGLGRLGVDITYVGAVGTDQFGDFFKEDMEKHGVRTLLERYPVPTGVSIVLVSPDGERTFLTYLGAALSLSEKTISSAFENYTFDWLYIEGYLVDNKDLLSNLVKLATYKQVKMALDLANFAIVEANRKFLQNLIESSMDIVFANAEECVAYCHALPQESVEYWKKLSLLAVLKLGKNGSMAVYHQEVVEAPAFEATVVDTTGVGDLFAAGFLYGLSKGWSIEKCLTIGNRIAAEVIQVVGAKLSDDIWKKIKILIEK